MKKYFITALFIFLFCFNSKTQTKPRVDTPRVFSFMEEWKDARYRFGGTSQKGIDCSALMQKAYQYIFNLDIPRTAIQQFKALTRISLSDLEMGDLVFFRSRYSPSGWHVGMYLSNGLFFHAANRHSGVTLNSLNEDYYKKSFRGGGRL